MAVSPNTSIEGIDRFRHADLSGHIMPLPRHRGDDWRKEALCAESDPELFSPSTGESADAAKKICASCDVRAQCLAYALENDERSGIWGGLSPLERRRLRSKASAHERARTARRKRDLDVVAQRQNGRDATTIARVTGLNERTIHRIIRQARTDQIAV